jgi:hypothetical protein
MTKMHPGASHLPGSYEWTASKPVSTVMRGDAMKLLNILLDPVMIYFSISSYGKGGWTFDFS